MEVLFDNIRLADRNTDFILSYFLEQNQKKQLKVLYVNQDAKFISTSDFILEIEKFLLTLESKTAIKFERFASYMRVLYEKANQAQTVYLSSLQNWETEIPREEFDSKVLVDKRVINEDGTIYWENETMGPTNVSVHQIKWEENFRLVHNSEMFLYCRSLTSYVETIEILTNLETEPSHLEAKESKVVEKDFAFYLKEEGQILLPKLKMHFTDAKPLTITAMVFALHDLSLLTQHPGGINRTSLHRALEMTFGRIGTRQSLNMNIANLTGANFNNQEKIKEQKLKIRNM